MQGKVLKSIDKAVAFRYITTITSMAYCVIGSTADSGSVSEGSTPSRPVFYGPFVYRLGWKILSLQRGVRFP